MSEEKCFCHLNGYKVKDADARNSIETIKENIENINGDIKKIDAAVSGLDAKVKTNIENLTAADKQINNLNNEFSKINTLNNRKFIIIGDSYGEGYTPDGNVTGWVNRLISLLGIDSENCYPINRGGVCFANLSNNFIDLLNTVGASIENKSEITDIVVCGGYNDLFFDLTDINNGINTFISFCLTEYPKATIRLGSIGWSADSTKIFNLTKVCAAYQSHSSGRVVYLNGVENILHHTSYMASDGYHPNDSGQKELANGIANAILTGYCAVTRGYTVSKLIPAPGWEVSNQKGFATMQANDVLEFMSDTQTFTHEAFEMKLNGTMYELGTFENTHMIGSKDGLTQVTVPCVLNLANSGYNYISYPLTFTIQGCKLFVSGNSISYAGANDYATLNVMKIQTRRFNLTGSTRKN